MADRMTSSPAGPAVRRAYGTPAADWVNIAAAIWLFFTPWFTEATERGAWNAWIVALVILVVAFVSRTRPRTEGINIAAGIWLFLSPWILEMTPPMAWNSWIVSLIVLIASAVRLGAGPRHGPVVPG